MYAVGSDIDWLQPGEFVLMEHGRWTKGVQIEDDGEEFDLRVADPEGILGKSEDRPDDPLTVALLHIKHLTIHNL